MKSLFDSSAIFRAIKESRIELLAGNFTLELARYELGNIVWKQCALKGKVSEQEARALVKTIGHTLCTMEVMSTAGNEEAILNAAIELKVTFYDASYAFFAKAKGLRLITEDARLIKKMAPAMDVSTLDGIA
ncbi:MAG: type II toxin-antitoxin system VapC family toxin [Candidatus Verstraetearchaeota archaeon]|nr:type II toxin-antitoxin system VapC family toxin [Candidatus Verstraetearchaeota archaeon]